MKNIVLTLFGSSIMEGKLGAARAEERWYNQMQRALSNHFAQLCFPIFNAAVGGQSTRECMARFESEVVATRPDFCLVMIGANNHDCRNPARILADGELEALMAEFAAGLPSACQPVGVVLNPVIDEWHFVTKDPAFSELIATYGGLNASLEPERNAFRRFIREHQWPSLDLCEAFGEQPADFILPEDGIHLNRAGHALFGRCMFELLLPLIEKKLLSDP